MNSNLNKLKSRLKLRLHQLCIPFKKAFAERGIFFSENERKLWKLKDKHKGEKAVIIGMGPSLKPSDLERFKGFVSFGCNKIYLAYDQVDWRPDYYSAMDSLVIENNYEEIKSLNGSTMVFPKNKKKYLPKNTEYLFYDIFAGIKSKKFLKKKIYSETPIEGIISGGGTVLLPLIQMAYWCGCDPVYIVGLDFSFEVPKATSERSADNEVVLEAQGEVNHFHPDYRKQGEKWTYPKLDRQIDGFKFAGEAFKNDGRQLLNASRVSKLTVLEKVDFDTVFNAH